MHVRVAVWACLDSHEPGNAGPDPGGASHMTSRRYRREGGAGKPELGSRTAASLPKYVHDNILVSVWPVQGDS